MAQNYKKGYLHDSIHYHHKRMKQEHLVEEQETPLTRPYDNQGLTYRLKIRKPEEKKEVVREPSEASSGIFNNNNSPEQQEERQVEDSVATFVTQLHSGYYNQGESGAQLSPTNFPHNQLQNIADYHMEMSPPVNQSRKSGPASEEVRHGQRRQQRQLEVQPDVIFQLSNFDMAFFNYGADECSNILTALDIAFLEYRRNYPKFLEVQNKKNKGSPRFLSPFEQAFLRFSRQQPQFIRFVSQRISGEEIPLLSEWDRAYLDQGRNHPQLPKVHMKELNGVVVFQLDAWEKAFLTFGRMHRKEVRPTKDEESQKNYFLLFNWDEAVLNWGRQNVKPSSIQRQKMEDKYVLLLSDYHIAILQAGRKNISEKLIIRSDSGAYRLSKWATLFCNYVEDHPDKEMLEEDGRTFRKWDLAIFLEGETTLLRHPETIHLSQWQRQFLKYGRSTVKRASLQIGNDSVPGDIRNVDYTE